LSGVPNQPQGETIGETKPIVLQVKRFYSSWQSEHFPLCSFPFAILAIVAWWWGMTVQFFLPDNYGVTTMQHCPTNTPQLVFLSLGDYCKTLGRLSWLSFRFMLSLASNSVISPLYKYKYHEIEGKKKS
jgi:hypothetical protein